MIPLLMAIPVIVGKPPAHDANCPVAEAHFTSGMIEGGSVKGFHKLDREPQPKAYLAVTRKIERCDVPVVVPSVLTQGR